LLVSPSTESDIKEESRDELELEEDFLSD